MGDDKAVSVGTGISQISIDKSTGETKMQELEVTFDRAAQIWWAYFWRSLLLAALVGFVLGFIIGLVGAIVGLPPHVSTAVTLFFTIPSGAIVAIWVLSRVLKKKFRAFRIALVQY